MNLQTRNLPARTDVLIVGAGPTGMALAIALRQAGVDHVLIDKLPQGLNTSRAGVIHSHTLDVLDRIGVSGELAQRGLKMTDFCIRDRDRALVQLSFKTLPSAHPYMLMLPQDQTELVLSQRLTALAGTIHRGFTATAVHQHTGGATVTVQSGREMADISARYVVGADGMHSIVRESAGIEFEGGTYAESFVLADVRMDWQFGAREVSLFFSPAGMVVVAPMPNGTYRVVATVDAAPESPSCGDVQALIDARGPSTRRNRVEEVVWGSRFRIHHRVARSYAHGRLLLMGDAAHVHSPAGGQGMNTGLVDAVVLGELLARVVRGESSETSLDLYQQLRRPAAEKVLALAGFLTSMATMRGTAKRFLRNALLSSLDVVPPAKRRLQMNLSGLSRKELSAVPPLLHGGATREELAVRT